MNYRDLALFATLRPAGSYTPDGPLLEWLEEWASGTGDWERGICHINSFTLTLVDPHGQPVSRPNPYIRTGRST